VSSTINSPTIGTSQVVIPLTTPALFASDEHYYVTCSGFVSSDRIASVGITWDNP
jgi:hypothetical protein